MKWMDYIGNIRNLHQISCLWFIVYIFIHDNGNNINKSFCPRGGI